MDPVTLTNPTSAPNFAAFISQIIDAVIAIGAPVAVIFLIYSGFLFVTARGNEEQLKTAKRNFFWVIIGIAVLLGAKALSVAIGGTISAIVPAA